MKIEYDKAGFEVLDGLVYRYKTDRFVMKTNYGVVYLVYRLACKQCGEPYFERVTGKGGFCSGSCAVRCSCKESFFKSGKDNIMFGRYGSKNSMFGKGYLFTGERNHFYGKKHNERSLELMRQNNPDYFGKNNPNYGNGDKIMGNKNPNWKGGISCEPYCDVWLDKGFKESIKQRDGYKCMNPDCWGNTYRLSVHHIDYNKKNCDPQNLITLCTSCNARANFNRKWHTAWYRAIMYRRKSNGA